MTLWIFLLAGQVGAADKTAFKSGPDRVSLLELYSSEGCSSCPPADEWVSDLAKARGLWSDFVPVAFQVDYWDQLGWKDPLASPGFSQRQRDYARAWGRDGVYTPGLVLNGNELRGWGLAPPVKLKDEAGTLEASQEGPFLFNVRYRPTRQGRRWIAHAALLGFGLSSRVTAGENRGRSLRHDFAALDLREESLDAKGQARLRLRPRPGLAPTRYAVAVWITVDDDPAPTQATGGYL